MAGLESEETSRPEQEDHIRRTRVPDTRACFTSQSKKRSNSRARRKNLLWAVLPFTLWWLIYNFYGVVVPAQRRPPVQHLCFLPKLDRALIRMLSLSSALGTRALQLNRMHALQNTGDSGNEMSWAFIEQTSRDRRPFATIDQTRLLAPNQSSAMSMQVRLCGSRLNDSTESQGHIYTAELLAAFIYSLHAFVPAATFLVLLYLVAGTSKNPRMSATSLDPTTWTVTLDLLSSYGWLNFIAIILHILWPTAPPWFVLQETGAFWPTSQQCAASTNAKSRRWYSRRQTGSAARLEAIDEWLGLPLYSTLFKRNLWVFAAFPSLHVATATWMAIKCTEYAIRQHSQRRFITSMTPCRKYALMASAFKGQSFVSGNQAAGGHRRRVFFALVSVSWAYVVSVSWAAVFLRHHYVVDCLAGLVEAFLAVGCSKCCRRPSWLPPQSEPRLCENRCDSGNFDARSFRTPSLDPETVSSGARPTRSPRNGSRGQRFSSNTSKSEDALASCETHTDFSAQVRAKKQSTQG